MMIFSNLTTDYKLDNLEIVLNNIQNHKIVMNTKRITIIIDDDLDRKLRALQAKQIMKSTKNVSFSNIMNQVLRKSLK